MHRRAFVVGLMVIGVPRAAAAQQAKAAARVGVLASSTEANFAPSVKVFREALKDAGWVEGRNLSLDVRYGGEDYAKLAAMAVELVRFQVDIIAAFGTPATQTAKRATASIPIVMESLSDAVSTGFGWRRTSIASCAARSRATCPSSNRRRSSS